MVSDTKYTVGHKIKYMIGNSVREAHIWRYSKICVKKSGRWRFRQVLFIWGISF